MELFEQLTKKEIDKETLVEEMIRCPKSIDQLFEGLNHNKGMVKFGCEKILRWISERRPDLLYTYFDDFVALIDSNNSFIKWGALITISNLASVDEKSKFENIFDKYYSGVTKKNMVSAANIIRHSWKIANVKPKLADRIVKEILKVETTKYERKGEISPECNNVICGGAIDSFETFFDVIEDKKPVVEFVKRQLSNSRKTVVKKAEKFLKKHKLS